MPDVAPFYVVRQSPVAVLTADLLFENVYGGEPYIRENPYLFDQLPTRTLRFLADRWLSPWPSLPTESVTRQYALSLNETFQAASREYQSVTINPEVMGGAPCIKGTRIPVYMVLDAIEFHGDLDAALRNYPNLTLQQVKDAIGFAKLVVECPVDERPAPALG